MPNKIAYRNYFNVKIESIMCIIPFIHCIFPEIIFAFSISKPFFEIINSFTFNVFTFFVVATCEIVICLFIKLDLS